MIADLGSFGVFGFLMQFLIISGTRFRGNSNLWKKLSACLPLLVTAIFSQPIAGSPMIYVLVMVFIPFVWMDNNLIN